MGLFQFGKKNTQQEQDQTPQNPGNPTTMLLFRVLAIGYVLWMLKGLVEAYVAGGPDAPSLGMLLGAIAVLGGGCVFIGIMTYKQWKKMKVLEKEYNEEVACQYAEEERLAAEKEALEEAYPEDAQYFEEETLEETE